MALEWERTDGKKIMGFFFSGKFIQPQSSNVLHIIDEVCFALEILNGIFTSRTLLLSSIIHIVGGSTWT